MRQTYVDKNSRGITTLTALLLIAVLCFCGLFIAQMYIHHVNDAKMTFDRNQVSNAIKAAKVQYMEDGFGDDVTYYFDAVNGRMLDWDEIDRIEGYGRSDRKHNADAQTGAKGIPNLGGKNGAQFLAISVEDNGNKVYARWQGHKLTAYDYTIMTASEKQRLNTEQIDQIRQDEKNNSVADSTQNTTD
ncbi:MAG: hypothetical protein ACI4ET_07580 [Bilifractor sp.]